MLQEMVVVKKKPNVKLWSIKTCGMKTWLVCNLVIYKTWAPLHTPSSSSYHWEGRACSNLSPFPSNSCPMWHLSLCNQTRTHFRKLILYDWLNEIWLTGSETPVPGCKRRGRPFETAFPFASAPCSWRQSRGRVQRPRPCHNSGQKAGRASAHTSWRPGTVTWWEHLKEKGNRNKNKCGNEREVD